MSERGDLLQQLSIGAGARDSESGSGAWLWWGLGAALLAAVAGIYLYMQRTPETKVELVAAIAMTQRNAGGAVLEGSGYVVARRQATVSAKTTGKVLEVNLEEGMQVEAGQILARLDPTNLNVELELARSQLRAASSRVAETEVSLREAEREFARQQELSARKLTSQQAFEQARSAVEILRARLTSVRSEIEVSRSALKINEQQLDDAVVRAPFAGMVIAKAAQPGEMISPLSAGGGFTRTGIGTIVDMDSLEVEIDVGESFIARVLPRQRAQITLNSYPDDLYTGYVIAIIPTADRTKATVKVRVGFDKRDARVLPEMGARVRFLSDDVEVTAAPPKGVLIPAGAVLDGKVWLLSGGALTQRTVQVAETIGSNLRVAEGLVAGDKVVYPLQDGLTEGQRIAPTQ